MELSYTQNKLQFNRPSFKDELKDKLGTVCCININLFDQKSIQAAVKAIRDYENSLTYKCRLLAEKLAKKGIEVARMQVTSLDAIFTGDLMRSIHAEYVGNIKGGGIWAVVADDESAVFVEFGTLGSLGEKKEYPYPLPEGVQWNYGTNMGSLSIDTSKLTSISNSIQSIANAASSMNTSGIKNISTLTNSINRMGKIDTSGLSRISSALKTFSADMAGTKVDTFHF